MGEGVGLRLVGISFKGGWECWVGSGWVSGWLKARIYFLIFC